MKPVKAPNSLDSLAPVIGLRIRELRTTRNMSQKELVGERFSKSYISSIERGKITPSLKALEYIAKRLDVTVAFLLTGSDKGDITSFSEDDGDSFSRWDSVISEARILREQRKYDQARNLLNTRIKIRQLSVEQLKQYYYLLALLHIDQDNHTFAIQELERVLELAEKTADLECQAKVKHLVGVFYMLEGKPVLAVEQLRAALQAIDGGGVRDYQFQLSVYSNLAILQRQLGDQREAINMYEAAVNIAEKASQPEKLAEIFWELSNHYRQDQNPSLARVYTDKSLVLYELANSLRALTQLRAGFGSLLLDNKQFDRAEAQFDQAKILSKLRQDSEALTFANMNMAELYLERGDLDKACDYSDEMLKTIDSADATTRGQAYSSRGNLLTVKEQYAEAIEYFEKALALLENVAAKDQLSKVYFRYAGALRGTGDATRAAEMYERAYHHLNRG